MSSDLNKIYDNIKKQISDLPIVKAHIEAVYPIEHFSLPPFPEDKLPNFKELLENNPDSFALQDMVKYNVDQREIYDVVDDFDKSPSELSQEKAKLRKKYLNIILSIAKERKDMIKTELTNLINRGVGLPGLEQYDPAFNTMLRIIKLLIMEIDGPEPCPACPKPEPCPACPKPEPCPEIKKCDNKYYIYTILALIIILVIMGILLKRF